MSLIVIDCRYQSIAVSPYYRLISIDFRCRFLSNDYSWVHAASGILWETAWFGGATAKEFLLHSTLSSVECIINGVGVDGTKCHFCNLAWNVLSYHFLTIWVLNIVFLKLPVTLEKNNHNNNRICSAISPATRQAHRLCSNMSLKVFGYCTVKTEVLHFSTVYSFCWKSYQKGFLQWLPARSVFLACC